MANKQTAGFGLEASGVMGSTPATSGQGKYWIDAGDATAIYNGELVRITAGYVVTAQAAVTNPTQGVFNGCFYNDATTLKPTWVNYYPGGVTPANSEDVKAYVMDNPFQIYNVVTDAQIAANVPASHAKFMETYGMNVSATSGTASGGRSSSTLKVSAGSHATNNQFRYLGDAEDPENSDVTAAFATVRVVQALNDLVMDT